MAKQSWVPFKPLFYLSHILLNKHLLEVDYQLIALCKVDARYAVYLASLNLKPPSEVCDMVSSHSLKFPEVKPLARGCSRTRLLTQA